MFWVKSFKTKFDILIFRYLLLCFLFAFGALICAQEQQAYIKKIGIEDGLSSYSISDIIQDARGVMWFATDHGLNSYDGATVKSYTVESHGLPCNRIINVAADIHGNLWIWSTSWQGEHNISIFNPILEKIYTIEEYTEKEYPFDLNQGVVISSCVNGSVVLSSIEEGIASYYEYKGDEVEKLFSFKADSINGTTFAGVVKANNRQFFVKTFQENEIEGKRYVSIVEDGQIVGRIDCTSNSKMLGTMGESDEGIYVICVDLVNETTKNISFLINGEYTTPITIATHVECFLYHNHKIYVIGEGALSIYNTNGVLEQKIALGIKLSLNTRACFIDRDHNIWFHNDQHVYMVGLTTSKFELPLSGEEESYKIRTVQPIDSNQIYVGGRYFMFEMDKDSITKRINDASDYAFIGALHDPSNDSLVWIGTFNQGLVAYNRYTHKKKQYFRAERGNYPFYWKPHLDVDQRIWVGMANGIYRLDDSRELLVPLRDSTAILQESAVYHFYENEQGTWLCTSQGLFLVDLSSEQILAHYHTGGGGEHYLPTNDIFHLYEDENQVFWLATRESGLVRWNPKTGEHHKFTSYNAGLSHNTIYSVYGDEQGRLWMSSYNGIMSFDKESHLVNIYLTDDGLPHNEFNTIAHATDDYGNLYFGSQSGLVKFHPDSFGRKGNEPPFIIVNATKKEKQTNNITAITEQVLTNQIIYINPDDKQVDLNFALLDYTKTSAIQYSYKIEGYDNDWNYQKENFLRIIGLPYGRYQLKLRAKPSGGSDWINYEKEITIVVSAPFYLEWWFILVAIVGVLGGGFLILQWRTKVLIARQQQLEIIVENRTAEIAKQAEELKMLDKVKSNFFANISHELRTPLTLILGPLSYILDNPEKLEEDKVKEQLYTMQRNGKSLMELINEILDLTKLEANKLEIQEEPTPVKAFFERMYRVFEPQFEKQNLVVELVFDFSTKDLTILMDRNKIEKIWNNFLSNALKFTPTGGDILIEVAEVGDNLNWKVRDSGKGVHPDDLPYIFDRFYQSKQADQKLYGGTGIGLALVREFAELMNGSVDVVSKLGEGSTFLFQLPMQVVNPQIMVFTDTVEEAEVDMIELPVDFTILVVEDNEDMRNFVCQLLAPKYNILIAQNGAEGLKKIEENHREIDLILSDIMMPEVDGLTLLKEVKSNESWKSIPVIMLTALAAERDKLKALRIGVDDYLVKPFSVTELLVRVKNVLYNYYQRKLILEEDVTLLPTTSTTAQIEGVESIIVENEDVWLREVENLIIESMSDEIISIEKLAQQSFLSPRQLRRRIKLATGLTTNKFIREVQLRVARDILEEGNVLTVKEVAYQTGFEQAGTFSKLFKKRFGKLPSDYLK